MIIADPEFRATKVAELQPLCLTLVALASLQSYLRNFHPMANCGVLGFTPLLRSCYFALIPFSQSRYEQVLNRMYADL